MRSPPTPLKKNSFHNFCTVKYKTQTWHTLSELTVLSGVSAHYRNEVKQYTYFHFNCLYINVQKSKFYCSKTILQTKFDRLVIRLIQLLFN